MVPIDAVDTAKEIAGAIGGDVEIVIRLGELVASDRTDQIGRHDDDKFGLVALEGAAAEKGSKDRNVLGAGITVDNLSLVIRTRPANHH